MRPLRSHLATAALMIAVVSALGPARTAQAASKSLLEGVEIFQVEPAHSPIDFSITFMGLSRVRGAFADFTAAIALDRADLTRSSITVVIHMRSLTTLNELRDRDLKGADWFDVEKFPLAVFSSREIVKRGQAYLMRGDLELHGVTKEIEIPFTFNGGIKSPVGDDIVGFEGSAVMNRKDYGIVGPASYNALVQVGKAMVGDEVDLALAVEAYRPALRDTLLNRAADSLFRAVGARGAAVVAGEYRSLRAATPDSLMSVRESQLNTVGMQLVERDRPLDAIEIFKLEAESYPASASGLSGLAYAYARLGDRANAIASAAQAVALNPASARALEILRRVRPRT